jgi:Prokaryotic homologs of the JAB domain
MREVCLLIGKRGAILWADASTSPTALPDSRERWDAIWAHREELDAIAHSHPVGPAAFSAEDESTMAALDAALGRPLRYYVVAPHVTVTRAGDVTETIDPEPWWAGLIRLASGMRKEARP